MSASGIREARKNDAARVRDRRSPDIRNVLQCSLGARRSALDASASRTAGSILDVRQALTLQRVESAAHRLQLLWWMSDPLVQVAVNA